MNLFLKNALEGKKKNLKSYILIFLISFIILNCISSIIYLLPDLSITTFIGYLVYYIKNINNLGHIIGFGIFILLAVKFYHKRDMISVINISNLSSKTVSRFKKIRWRNILKGILIWAPLMLVLTLIPVLIYPNYYALNPNTNIIFLIIAALLFIPAQSISEEIAFRGYLNQGLFLKIKNPLIIILISSFIFGLAHIGSLDMDSLITFFNTFLFGLILSIFVLTENGLETAMGMHIINNLFAIPLISDVGINMPTTIFMITHEISFTLDQLLEPIFSILFLVILILYKRKEIKNLWNK